MKAPIEAVIFDMDGIIIDSEPFWKRAEYKIFNLLGVNLSDELCLKTKSMTTTEVTKFWYSQDPWSGFRLEEVEKKVIEYVGFLIETEGKEISGITNLLSKLKQMNYKIGLATNSPYCLIEIVLRKLGITKYFDTISSAEHEPLGKPHPAVYISTANKLKVSAESCIVIEDSVSGLRAAKLAKMNTVGLISMQSNLSEILSLADKVIYHYSELKLPF